MTDSLDEKLERAIEIGIALGAGLTKTDVAEALQVSRPTVYNYLNEFPNIIATITAKAKQIMAATIMTSVAEASKIREQHYLKAMNNITETLDDTEDKQLRYRASTDTLDRFEGKAIQRIKQTSDPSELKVTFSLPIEELQALRALTLESAKVLLPPAIDAEFSEDNPSPDAGSQ